ncbi:amylovoran biosynthesis protein AmsE [Enterobacter hormaechei subsp. hoffmannii]|uniref:glycosyltransferase n=1 Tax=Enterobacter hormaechei TaxID=158836 RepID=UPI00084BD63E|nr:glycosyltransferase [Enterobacter hormaechei]AOQ00564.1 amylovoran biosynthesis protein AmsE [Enterobacter hormaechei subsp. hoffmannii]RCA18266.1 amylovoran biosynthesis protein AmsE [Enterobacter hormaechei]
MTDFSVLMSIYSREKVEYLRSCLDSLAKQTSPANEIIIVIDGPISDKLNNEIAMWSEKLPIKTVNIKENVGLGSALNIGLQYCSNDLVARMDTDDICEQNRFSLQLSKFNENVNLQLLGGAIEEYDESMTIVKGIRKTPENYADILAFAKKRNPFNHMTVMFKKSIIQEVGGYQHHLFMEDYNLWLRVLASGRIVQNLSDVLVKVRGGDGMIKRRKGTAYIKSEIQLFHLKNKLKIVRWYNGLITLALRVFVRLLPLSILRDIYSYMRATK